MLPRDVECPHCKAKVDWPCRTTGGYRAATHTSRWRAAGVEWPTDEQRGLAYADGVKRDLELTQRALSRMQ